ncbi:hypothetical protein BDY19DRAFT_908534 [Irpex rosettiformis]|uniref:Uncharacterized protein n=1 Tax=Irpex rosettiformis TaxID=378272 RepID=A0ACB8TVC3_9APHY|nr:hypothetical protein BDY19DRAFT_908534 [Irpex rosettiformis]
MPALRSTTTRRAPRSTCKTSLPSSSPYVTALSECAHSLTGPKVANASHASQSDYTRYPKFESLEKIWRTTIDVLGRLKTEGLNLERYEFDEEKFSMGRLEGVCRRLGIDVGIFDLHVCVTRDGKKIAFCFACLYQGPDVPPRSYSLRNIGKNVDRHPNSDGHCRVVGKLLGVDWHRLVKKLTCSHPGCLYSLWCMVETHLEGVCRVNAARGDQYNKHLERVHEGKEAPLPSPPPVLAAGNAMQQPILRSHSSLSSSSSSSSSTSSIPTPLTLDSSSFPNDEFDHKIGGMSAFSQPPSTLNVADFDPRLPTGHDPRLPTDSGLRLPPDSDPHLPPDHDPRLPPDSDLHLPPDYILSPPQRREPQPRRLQRSGAQPASWSSTVVFDAMSSVGDLSVRSSSSLASLSSRLMLDASLKIPSLSESSIRSTSTVYLKPIPTSTSTSSSSRLTLSSSLNPASSSSSSRPTSTSTSSLNPTANTANTSSSSSRPVSSSSLKPTATQDATSSSPFDDDFDWGVLESRGRGGKEKEWDGTSLDHRDSTPKERGDVSKQKERDSLSDDWNDISNDWPTGFLEDIPQWTLTDGGDGDAYGPGFLQW